MGNKPPEMLSHKLNDVCPTKTKCPPPMSMVFIAEGCQQTELESDELCPPLLPVKMVGDGMMTRVVSGGDVDCPVNQPTGLIAEMLCPPILTGGDVMLAESVNGREDDSPVVM